MGKLTRPFDSITNEYVERELQKLMAEQEMVREKKGLKDAAKQMKNGGKMKYPYGGGTMPDYSEIFNRGFLENNLQELPKEESIPYEGFPKGFDTSDYNKQYYAKGALDETGVSTKPQPKEKFDWAGAGVLGAQLAGDVVGLGYALQKPNYAKYQRVSPQLVNYNQAVTDITNQSGLMEQSASQAIRNQGQSSGAYLNNRINLASRLGQQTGAQIGQLRMNEANANTGELNKARYANAEIQRAETETNAREKDAKWQALVGHLGGIGSKVAGYNKDKQAMKLDKTQFDTMMRLYPSLFRASDIVQNSDGTYTIKGK